jgi:hypothetical protein
MLHKDKHRKCLVNEVTQQQDLFYTYDMSLGSISMTQLSVTTESSASFKASSME